MLRFKCVLVVVDEKRAVVERAVTRAQARSVINQSSTVHADFESHTRRVSEILRVWPDAEARSARSLCYYGKKLSSPDWGGNGWVEPQWAIVIPQSASGLVGLTR